MSPWTHAQCAECWDKARPDRPATHVLNIPPDVCCFCGKDTRAGIYVRADPKPLRCKGVHEDKP